MSGCRTCVYYEDNRMGDEVCGSNGRCPAAEEMASDKYDAMNPEYLYDTEEKA